MPRKRGRGKLKVKLKLRLLQSQNFKYVYTKKTQLGCTFGLVSLKKKTKESKLLSTDIPWKFPMKRPLPQPGLE